MNIETIKALFEEMRKSGVLMFKHTAVDGTTTKVVMNGAEVTDATGVSMESNEGPNMGFEPESLYKNRTLKLKDFNG
jgi:hypothetical protein